MFRVPDSICLVSFSVWFCSYWVGGLSRIFPQKSHLERCPPHETHFSSYPLISLFAISYGFVVLPARQLTFSLLFWMLLAKQGAAAAAACCLMPAACSLLAARCWLLAACCWLLAAAGCWLLLAAAGCCLLLAAACSCLQLLTVACSC